MIKENSLTLDDLDAIWKAQHGKHEAIVKNLHDLLAKLAWDFTPDQLDHLFDCFKVSYCHPTVTHPTGTLNGFISVHDYFSCF